MGRQYTSLKVRAAEDWRKPNSSFVMLSFDYARQLDIPLFVDEPTAGYRANKKSLDVNLFGVVNEGPTDEFRHPYFLREGIKNGSDTVCSMLNHYIQNFGLRDARSLSLWSDSCTCQNMNNIVLSFLTLLVENGVVDKVHWRFLAIGHK